MNYKDLYRKVERTLGRIERSGDLEKTLALILKSLVDDYQQELGISGGRIYGLRGRNYILISQYGREARVALGFRIPVTYPPMRMLGQTGFICMGPEDPGFDPKLEARIGAMGDSETSPRAPTSVSC